MAYQRQVGSIVLSSPVHLFPARPLKWPQRGNKHVPPCPALVAHTPCWPSRFPYSPVCGSVVGQTWGCTRLGAVAWQRLPAVTHRRRSAQHSKHGCGCRTRGLRVVNPVSNRLLLRSRNDAINRWLHPLQAEQNSFGRHRHRRRI